jgi:aminoglycoside phosphotransferase (APT) family kinase protein
MTDGRPVALIDFDVAHPGPRAWDLAYAAYRFVPLTAGGHAREQLRRLRRRHASALWRCYASGA